MLLSIFPAILSPGISPLLKTNPPHIPYVLLLTSPSSCPVFLAITPRRHGGDSLDLGFSSSGSALLGT